MPPQKGGIAVLQSAKGASRTNPRCNSMGLTKHTPRIGILPHERNV